MLHQNDACAHAGPGLLDQKLQTLQELRATISSAGVKCFKLSVHHFNPIVNEFMQTMDVGKKTMKACK